MRSSKSVRSASVAAAVPRASFRWSSRWRSLRTTRKLPMSSRPSSGRAPGLSPRSLAKPSTSSPGRTSCLRASGTRSGATIGWLRPSTKPKWSRLSASPVRLRVGSTASTIRPVPDRPRSATSAASVACSAWPGSLLSSKRRTTTTCAAPRSMRSSRSRIDPVAQRTAPVVRVVAAQVARADRRALPSPRGTRAASDRGVRNGSATHAVPPSSTPRARGPCRRSAIGIAQRGASAARCLAASLGSVTRSSTSAPWLARGPVSSRKAACS